MEGEQVTLDEIRKLLEAATPQPGMSNLQRMKLEDIQKAARDALRYDSDLKALRARLAKLEAVAADYYAGLLDEIGVKLFGPAVYVSDDGSIQDSPLRAKMPELASALHDRLAKLEAVAEAGKALVLQLREDEEHVGYFPIGAVHVFEEKLKALEETP